MPSKPEAKPLTLADFHTDRDQRRVCKVAIALSELDPKLRPVFEEAIGLLDDPDSGITASKIGQMFAEHGATVRVAIQTFTPHRNKACSCFVALKNAPRGRS